MENEADNIYTPLRADGRPLSTVKFIYRNHEFNVNWIWSDVLRPQDRFIVDRGGGYFCGTVLGDEVLVLRIHQALERETIRDTFEIGGSFPSPYWDSVSDYRNELEDNPDNGLMTETACAPSRPRYRSSFVDNRVAKARVESKKYLTETALAPVYAYLHG